VIILNTKAPQTTVESLKEIISIVTGLTITNSTLVLLTKGTYNDIYPITGLSGISILLFLFVTINVIRFYHGNMKHINSGYLRDYQGFSIRVSGGARLAIDFFVIFMQSILFSIMSFYLFDFNSFIPVFLLLLGIDIIWNLSKWTLDDRKELVHHKVWFLNNLICGIAIAIIFFTIEGNTKVILVCTTLFANTLLDYCIGNTAHIIAANAQTD